MRKVREMLHHNTAATPAATSYGTGYNQGLTQNAGLGNQQFFHPFANQYNLPTQVASWQQGQPIPQGWRLGRKGYLKPVFTLPANLQSWQQGQPIPEGYRLSKRGTLRPLNYFNWYTTTYTTTTSTSYAPQMSHLHATAPVIEHREKAAVVQEVIKPGVREEIQPVIHRDREQMEIREEIQPIYEKSVRPTIVEERQLAAEFKPEVRLGAAPVIAAGPQSSVFVEAEHREAVVHAPMVEETVHKKIIEEVQPVIHREVIAPKIINERKDIYEKIVEAPTVTYTTLPAQFGGSSSFASTTTTTFSQSLPQQQFMGSQFGGSQFGGSQFGGSQQFLHPFASQYNLPPQVASWQQGQAIPQGWRLGRKGYLKPALPAQYSSWQQGQALPQGYRLGKRGNLRPIDYWSDWSNYNKLQQGNASFVPAPVRQF